MKSSLMALLLGLVTSFLKDFAQEVWDGLWEELAKAAVKAEKKWKKAGEGRKKRKFVIKKVMNYINEKTDLSWLEKRIVSLFVGNVVDALIDTLNKNLGKDWGDVVMDIEDNVDNYIPFIE